MKKFNQLIKEIADELNIKVTFLSDNWLMVLEKDDKIGYIDGYKFSLNDHGIGNIMDDKGLFYDLLSYKKIPIIEHKIIFRHYVKEEVLKYFFLHNKEIIVKGNIGTCGNKVYKINDESELFIVIDDLFKSQFSISLCPYYDIINEYRVIILNNEVKLIYGKISPSIIGDGVKSVKQLACEFNGDYYSKKKNLLKLRDYIPKKDEKVVINYQFNLSKGAIVFEDIEKDLKKDIISLALKVSNSINLSFASIDIIKTKDNKLYVLEANSGVMMENYIRLNKERGYNIAKGIYKEAIEAMFK